MRNCARQYYAVVKSIDLKNGLIPLAASPLVILVSARFFMLSGMFANKEVKTPPSPLEGKIFI